LLPVFYQLTPLKGGEELQLDESNSRHVVQVLRMQPGERLLLTDGEGRSAEAVIVKADKKRCLVRMSAPVAHVLQEPALHLGVAFTKHAGRNEWLLEKATELGVRTIIPLITARTERERIRYERWRGILSAAMIQSQQFHLPQLREALPLAQLLEAFRPVNTKLIAHCMEAPEREPLAKALPAGQETLLLIGPEGDFTPEEVALCTDEGARGISLGNTRLRTETAAMAVCAFFNMINHEIP
jgi:16S rRNA (uracil1498-N3)-methyltransferase